jgi:hypothetical protein
LSPDREENKKRAEEMKERNKETKEQQATGLAEKEMR